MTELSRANGETSAGAVVLDALFNWQPVSFNQGRSDVNVFFSSDYEMGCSILHSMEYGEKIVRDSVQQAISIAKTRRHVGTHHHLCGFLM